MKKTNPFNFTGNTKENFDCIAGLEVIHEKVRLMENDCSFTAEDFALLIESLKPVVLEEQLTDIKLLCDLIEALGFQLVKQCAVSSTARLESLDEEYFKAASTAYRMKLNIK